jgi:hypothetical protein
MVLGSILYVLPAAVMAVSGHMIFIFYGDFLIHDGGVSTHVVSVAPKGEVKEAEVRTGIRIQCGVHPRS